MKACLSRILILMLPLFAWGCTAAPAPTPQPELGATAETRRYQMGVAGLIPAHHPNPAESDWLDLFQSLNQTGELLGVYTPWADSPDKRSEIPEAVTSSFALSERYTFTPVIALSFFRESEGGDTKPLLALDDPAERGQFVTAASEIARQYQPEFLAVGIEVNSYFIQHRDDFQNFVSLYEETYDAVKEISPQTLVFPIFQYERLRGGIFFAGDGQAEPQWDLIDQFGERLDMAAFTTYPFLLYDSPASLPEDYYLEIARHTDRPVAFTEIGWASEPLSVEPQSPWGGSPQEQADFVDAFFRLTSGLEMMMALWSFPHDIGAGFNPAFTSVSLRSNDGSPKPALERWQERVSMTLIK